VALTSVSTTGGPNGIFLKNTSGSFSVNGDGANTAVGGNATGGTISGMTGVTARRRVSVSMLKTCRT